MQRSRNYSGLGLLLLIVITSLLYLFTLDNGLRPDELTGGDLITHQYAQVEARPSNAPGYPLYTMLGWLWFRLGRLLFSGVLNPIQILSFYSTLWGIASLVVLYLILLDLLQRKWHLAFLLTTFYATTFFFWYYSVTTEQYTSAVFQTLLLILLAFKWDRSPCDSLLLGMAFISGTMLANMLTSLFILPPLLGFIFFKKSKNRLILYDYFKRPKLVLTALGLALVPLLSYLYIYIRGHQHPEWRGEGQWATTWDWFGQFITIQQGRDELAPGLNLQTIFTEEFPALMWQELTWLVFFGALFGLALLGRRRAIFLYTVLLIYFIFSWGYRFGNWFQVIIPAYPIFIIGFAAVIKELLTRWTPTQYRKMAEGVIILLLVALLGYRFTSNLPRANQYNRPSDIGLDPAWVIIADQPSSPATVFGDFEERVALEYLHTVWNVQPLLIPVDLLSPATLKNNNVYLSRRASALTPKLWQTEAIYPQAAGEQLIALTSTPLTQLPPNAHNINLDFGHKIHLLGWEFIEPKPNLPSYIQQRISPANWQIALYWQAAGTMESDYTVSVRPLLESQLIKHGADAIIQDHQPVWGTYPTSRWQPYEIVRDIYALTLPQGITPDATQIVIYKSTADGFENLGEHILNLGGGN